MSRLDHLTRRQMMLAAGAAAFGAAPMSRLFAREPRAATKKVLFFTKSAGFQHSVIARKGDQLSLAEKILTELGRDHGFEVVATKDGRMFDPDKIGQWDAFAFETTGDLTTEGTDRQPPMSADGKKALLDAVHSGKGFVGMHCGSDTFHSRGQDVDPYIQMLGGEFAGHGDQQKAKVLIADPRFPGARSFGDAESFELEEEWYAQKNIADDLHVIYVMVTDGMKGPQYQRPNFPQTWARMHGKGRVFYTSFGHRDDVWTNPKFHGLLLGGLGWSTGQVDADVEPNIKKVTPHYDQVGK
ncbi:MAG TPA: ThuA domain-containing protein [Isosphaeraceae bacterium]|jgi:hypothetical protein|nr:ThuA domain-containing protein [Isosphaeraceae bacterium]